MLNDSGLIKVWQSNMWEYYTAKNMVVLLYIN